MFTFEATTKKKIYNFSKLTASRILSEANWVTYDQSSSEGDEGIFLWRCSVQAVYQLSLVQFGEICNKREECCDHLAIHVDSSRSTYFSLLSHVCSF